MSQTKAQLEAWVDAAKARVPGYSIQELPVKCELTTHVQNPGGMVQIDLTDCIPPPTAEQLAAVADLVQELGKQNFGAIAVRGAPQDSVAINNFTHGFTSTKLSNPYAFYQRNDVFNGKAIATQPTSNGRCDMILVHLDHFTVPGLMPNTEDEYDSPLTAQQRKTGPVGDTLKYLELKPVRQGAQIVGAVMSVRTKDGHEMILGTGPNGPSLTDAPIIHASSAPSRPPTSTGSTAGPEIGRPAPTSGSSSSPVSRKSASKGPPQGDPSLMSGSPSSNPAGGSEASGRRAAFAKKTAPPPPSRIEINLPGGNAKSRIQADARAQVASLNNGLSGFPKTQQTIMAQHGCQLQAALTENGWLYQVRLRDNAKASTEVQDVLKALTGSAQFAGLIVRGQNTQLKSGDKKALFGEGNNLGVITATPTDHSADANSEYTFAVYDKAKFNVLELANVTGHHFRFTPRLPSQAPDSPRRFDIENRLIVGCWRAKDGEPQHENYICPTQTCKGLVLFYDCTTGGVGKRKVDKHILDQTPMRYQPPQPSSSLTNTSSTTSSTGAASNAGGSFQSEPAAGAYEPPLGRTVKNNLKTYFEGEGFSTENGAQGRFTKGCLTVTPQAIHMTNLDDMGTVRAGVEAHIGKELIKNGVPPVRVRALMKNPNKTELKALIQEKNIDIKATLDDPTAPEASQRLDNIKQAAREYGINATSAQTITPPASRTPPTIPGAGSGGPGH